MSPMNTNADPNQSEYQNKKGFLLSMRMPTYVCLGIAVFVVALHGMASAFGWYWIFRWFDIPMHILGGVFAGYLGMIGYVFATRNRRPPAWVSVLSALAVGIAWEILEHQYGLAGLDPVHRFDTLKDLVDDMMGGVIALLIWDIFIYKKISK